MSTQFLNSKTWGAFFIYLFFVLFCIIWPSVTRKLEGPMLKLKLQHFGHLMRTADSLEKSLMLGKTEGRKRRGRQKMTWLDGPCNGHEPGQTLGDGEGQGGLACCSPWGRRVRQDWETEQQQVNFQQQRISYHYYLKEEVYWFWSSPCLPGRQKPKC